MPIEQLRMIHDQHKHLSSFKSIDLNAHACKMRKSCPGCCGNKSKSLPNYEPHPDSTIDFIPGLFCSGAVSLDDFEQHSFHMIDSGTTVGTVALPGEDIPEVALFIHVPKLPQISKNFEDLASLLHNGAKFGTLCRSNAAHKAAGFSGVMKVLGWRRAYDSTPWALYAMPPECRKDKVLKSLWRKYVRNIRRIQRILNQEFTSCIAQKLAHEAQDFVAEFHLPRFGDILADVKTHGQSLGCNFTISFLGFANQAHLDNDAFRYVFSLYIFVDKYGKLVTDRERIKKCMKGGHFLWPDLHLGLDPSNCNGVVLFIWRGTHERHCTMSSEILDDDVIRYGTSIQVNERLLASVLSYEKKMRDYEEDLEMWKETGKGKKPKRPTPPEGYKA
ncbi:hypothetical protein FRC08_004967 [Ceratobasidium sp. 394]|nr:hypothetical protein FRC08_004967 [Ceratobasidium sp. 394]